MKNAGSVFNRAVNRRSFLKKGAFVASAAAVGIETLGGQATVFQQEGREEKSGRLTKCDAALLRFAAAAEMLESDFWTQYNELGGIQDSEVPGGSGSAAYTAALQTGK
jgi:hypothetical protein